MKKASDPRHKHRILIVEQLFAQSFANQKRKAEHTEEILKNLVKIDQFISQAAPEWPVDKIAKIDLAILRLAVFELLIDRREPLKVIIDEAIEIAKVYGNDRSASFINGVLGTILKNDNKNLPMITSQEDKKIEKDISEIIAQRLEVPVSSVTLNAHLFEDLNASNLERADIIQTLEDKYQFKFDIEVIKQLETVGSIIEYIIDNVD